VYTIPDEFEPVVEAAMANLWEALSGLTLVPDAREIHCTRCGTTTAIHAEHLAVSQLAETALNHQCPVGTESERK
jgi:hypothetical protein